ncbi:diaminopimelate decarboxylase family protein [Chamaesiphon polymorphus]|uniref:Decarboxylase n=1 Tax=Chamaesiphon polymorphus CCALA 037 TaxID=2107692 RepID=A0A2T1GMS4_9CYAN|nr:decarboxylase [Chamaesiphon polymorphus]PSB59186.1 decarboxylase [Chamaesiphon polymorphus CCALA 037]
MERHQYPHHDSLPFSLSTAQELVSVYGSPLYVYQLDRLCDTIDRITNSIPYPDTQFQFASVTNGNVALLQVFKNKGWGIHANTPGDIHLALTAGFAPDRIVYSGSNLDRQELRDVLEWEIHSLNLDSLSQLETLVAVRETFVNPHTAIYPQPRLGLRLNFPALTGESRIGVHPDEFDRANEIARQAGLTIAGLHFYRGTGTNATQAFVDAIETILSIAIQLPDLAYLDFGGGFGYPYRHDKAAFDWLEFGCILTEKLAKLDKQIQLTIEPGRAAIAGCAVLLARVVSTKWQGEKQIVGVDTTVANLSVPSVHGGYREIVSWQNSDRLFTTDVCGNTTYSRDYLGRNCQLPRLKIGDIIAIRDVGAYGYAMSSHFLHRPRPAEVLLDGDFHRLIRQREDYRVLLTNQIFEEDRS